MKKMLLISTVANVIMAICLVILTSIVLVNGEMSISLDEIFVSKDFIKNKYDKGITLDKVLKEHKPTVVLFYADWCGYCQRFLPVFARLTKDKQLKTDFAFAYVNSEDPEQSGLFKEYNVEALPTMLVISKDGNKIQIPNNLMFEPDSKQVLKDVLYDYLNDGKVPQSPQPFRK